jgi:hypothetical protein
MLLIMRLGVLACNCWRVVLRSGNSKFFQDGVNLTLKHTSSTAEGTAKLKL